MTVTIIAALTNSRVIGKDNKLPWNLQEDLKNFKRLTTGNTVIMGRKTFESIGKPLPNRNNIIVSSSMPAVAGAIMCRTIEEAIAKARALGKDAFVIGGATIYKQALPFADKMILSHVKKDYEGDTYFPAFDAKEWIIESRQEFSEFEVVTYYRKNSIPA